MLFRRQTAVQLFLKGKRPPASAVPDFLYELQALIERVDRARRWRRISALIRACASHLVIEGDEDDA